MEQMCVSLGTGGWPLSSLGYTGSTEYKHVSVVENRENAFVCSDKDEGNNLLYSQFISALEGIIWITKDCR